MTGSRIATVVTLALVTLLSRTGLAHPMGNFSVNHYSRIELQPDRIRVQYLIDLAEIPAYQELQQGSVPAQGSDPATRRFVAARGVTFGRELSLTLDGQTLPLRLKSSTVLFPPGAGGLPTMKMGFVYEAAYPSIHDPDHVRVRYSDGNYAGHSGWKEIVPVAGRGSMLRSSVPATDRSEGLSNYPTDLLSSPPQDLEASFDAVLPRMAPVAVMHSAAPVSVASPGSIKVGAPLIPVSPIAVPKPLAGVMENAASPLTLTPNRQTTPRSHFTELITQQRLSAWFLFTAALIAFGLGGLHALEPGHGKTIVAAYLVGSRGTARHAVLLGLIVTAAHTAGVFALGAVTLYASRYVVPEQLYPWLGVLSGVTIVALGAYMLLQRITGVAADHDHGVDGGGHWFSSKRSGVPQADRAPSGPVSMGQLLTLGVTGGIIPCPAALIVLLSAFALHRIALGFFLIVAFSVGLATVLICFGMAMVYARRFVTRLRVDGPITKRWLPIASASFVMGLGAIVAWQGFVATPLRSHPMAAHRLGPLLFVIGLGLVLGMRHSTDADHVVAISTIVSKQRSVRGAAFIGSVWGIGHTITIFVVGSLIILFNVEIPVRLGLSMEFSVAVMLVLLGLANLTGAVQWVTRRLSAKNDFDGQTAEIGNNGFSSQRRMLQRTVRRYSVFHILRPLIIGLVHGLAGSAAVALLVLTTIHDPLWATFYLLVFGAGTLVGMMAMTAAMAVPLKYAGGRSPKIGQYLNFASGIASLSFGSFLVYQLGFVGGLFTNHPRWIPQ